jgi:hypothetical protein
MRWFELGREALGAAFLPEIGDDQSPSGGAKWSQDMKPAGGNTMKTRLAFGAAVLAITGLAQSATIDWNPRSSNTATTMDGIITVGSAPVAASYSGELGGGWYAAYPSWTPAGIWTDGSIVSNGPAGSIVRLFGGGQAIDTIGFAKPVFSSWSLDQDGHTASFDFDGVAPTLVAGGPSDEYGGSSIGGILDVAGVLPEPVSVGLMLAGLTLCALTRRYREN